MPNGGDREEEIIIDMKISNSLFTHYVWIIIFLHFNFNLYAQEQTSGSTTIYLEKAGELSKHISKDEKYKITNLTIVGYLNRDDFNFLKDMAGNSERINDFTDKNASQYRTEGKLSVLNLLDTKIQSPQDICFSHCLSLTSISLPKDLFHIDDGTFFRCSNLKEILMNNVSSIGWNAFYECSSLTDSTIISNNIFKIEPGAFNHCTGFTKIIIPDNVKFIYDKNVFQHCSNLKEFIVTPQNNNYTTIDGILLSKDLKTLIAYPLKKSKYYIPENIVTIGVGSFIGCENLTSITIPNTVKTIKESAFSGCSNLTSLRIPNSVRSIEGYAFYRCLNLKKIYINNSIPPSVGSNSFGGFYIYEFDKSACTLYIPKGSYNAYWFESGWRDFNIVETDFSTPNENIIMNDPVKVYSKNSNIIIETNKEIQVFIFSIEGKLITKLKVKNTQTVPLDKGIYIVNVDNYSSKVKVE